MLLISLATQAVGLDDNVDVEVFLGYLCIRRTLTYGNVLVDIKKSKEFPVAQYSRGPSR